MASQLTWFTRLAILLTILAMSWALSQLARRKAALSRLVRFSLAAALASNELIWYAYRLHEEGFRFPEGLPLQLCDLTLWLTVASALTVKPGIYEFAYFCGLGGSGMALLTPDLWAPFPSYPTVYFFLSHGLVVITLLTLTAGNLVHARKGCVWRTFGALNLYAAAAGVFDAVFRTNYMYLCRKPVNVSLLDIFGPWPTYILVADLFALAIFQLLWLPIRSKAAQAPAGAA